MAHHLLPSRAPDLDENVSDLEVNSQSEFGAQPPTTKVKGIGTKVVLLLAVCGIGAILYAHFKPQAEDASSNSIAKVSSMKGAMSLVSETPPAVSEKPPTAKVVGDILKMEIAKMRNSALVAGAPDKIQEEEAGLQEIEASGASAASLQKHNKMIKAAIDDMGDSALDVVAKKGDLVTSAMLQQINGLNSTPEAFMGTQTADVEAIGDMVFRATGTGRGRRLWAGTLWPDRSNIPYCFHPQTPSGSQIAFKKAVDHISNLVGCMGFKEVSAITGGTACQENGILVTAGAGCFAYVGHQTAVVNQVNLQEPGCDSMGIAAHEILHSLGMTHEQARPDHNSYVTIHWENIKQSAKHNYNTNSAGDTSLPYDYMSLMHYGDTDFSISPNVKTMTVVGAARGVIGQRIGMSSMDATQLANMYSCDVAKFKLCTNDPNQCTEEDCECHEVEGSPMIKTYQGTCKRCEPKCPDSSTGYCKDVCGCGAGFKKKTLGKANGGVCYACELGGPSAPEVSFPPAPAPAIFPTPAPAPTPPPTPPPPAPLPSTPPSPPAPPPSTPPSPPAPSPVAPTASSASTPPLPSADAPCVFPASPRSCPQTPRMPGCTNCDDELGQPWCFLDNYGRWRDCKASDNACVFPFEYNSVKHYTCITEGTEHGGKPWCKKVGGGTKLCAEQEGYSHGVKVAAYGVAYGVSTYVPKA